MYLSRLYVNNYRSIAELDISLSPGKNVLVGRNNAGKSNIIKAINLVLGESAPAYKKYENLTIDDFYTFGDYKSDVMIIWCELTRSNGEKLDYQNLYGSISSYPLAGDFNRVPTRHNLHNLPDAIQSVFTIQKNNNNSCWINSSDIAKGDLNAQLENKYNFAYAFIATRNGQEIEKDLRFFYREDESMDWFMSFYSPFRNELLQSALIPTFRDPQKQLSISSWNWYGKLMRSITQNSAYEGELFSAMNKVKHVSDKIFLNVENKVTSSAVKTAFPGTTLHFQFTTDTQNDLYKNCVIYVDDGFKSQLTDKGAGIQSAVIVGLFSYYMREINTIGSALLCIEEPELYLHPHGQRVMNNNLEYFVSDEKRNQVVLSTHSSEFVNTPIDAQIVIVRKVNGSTTANCVNTKKFKKILLDNNQNELFFSDKVIVCEGYDRYILRWVADFLYSGKLDEQNISIISVNGKDNFIEICKQLVSLGIEHYIFADFDFLLRDNTTDGKIYGAEQHKSLISVPIQFFEQERIYANQAGKEYGKIVKLQNRFKREDPNFFYTAKQVNEIVDDELLSQVKVFLSDLRSHGICILSGEIENSCHILPSSKNGKLDLHAIYALKSELDNGLEVPDLFDIEEIAEFLGHVLDLPIPEKAFQNYDDDDEDIPF